MSRIAVAGRDPLAVDRDAFGAGQPQLLDDRPDVGGADQVVGRVAAGQDGLAGIAQLEHDARALQRDQAGRQAGVLEALAEVGRRGRAALALRLEVADLAAQVEDLGLQGVLLASAARSPSRPAVRARRWRTGPAGRRTGAGRRPRSRGRARASPRVICQLGIRRSARRRASRHGPAVTAGSPGGRRRRQDEGQRQSRRR